MPQASTESELRPLMEQLCQEVKTIRQLLQNLQSNLPDQSFRPPQWWDDPWSKPRPGSERQDAKGMPTSNPLPTSDTPSQQERAAERAAENLCVRPLTFRLSRELAEFLVNQNDVKWRSTQSNPLWDELQRLTRFVSSAEPSQET